VCAGAPALVTTATASVAANVLPAVGDAKLCSVTGIAVPPAAAGKGLVLPLSFNTSTASLLAWSLLMNYDSSVFGQPICLASTSQRRMQISLKEQLIICVFRGPSLSMPHCNAAER
jgi:hypothetical protein